jgi:sulfoxide reductase heme-binding subunit YedZ
MQSLRKSLQPALHVACATPLGIELLRAFELAGFSLGPDPVAELIHDFGSWGLRLLLLTLCVTPLRMLLGKAWLAPLRRPLGLWSFAYLTLHFSSWLALDRVLDAGAIVADIVERPYITVGFAAFLMLIPLAVTSTAGWMRRLGRRWQRLHRLIYVVAILGCVHFWWQVKADWREPLVYVAILGALLAWRLRRGSRQRAAVRARASGAAAAIELPAADR